MTLPCLVQFIQTHLIDPIHPDTPNRLTHRVVQDYEGTYFWEADPAFQLTNHVFIPETVDPTAPWTEAQLLEYMGTIYNRPLNQDHPLFEVLLIPTLDDESALILRLHHLIGDGNAIIGTLLQLVDHAPSMQKFGKTPPSYWQQARQILSIPHILLTSALRGTDRNVLHPQHAISGTRRLAKTRVALSTIKSIKNQYGVTVNDVVMAALAGGFRRYYQQQQSRKIQSTTVVVPVNLRSKAEMAAMTLNNKVSMIHLTLPSEMDDPLGRLQQVAARMQRAKTSAEPLANYFMMQSIDMLDVRTRGATIRASAGKPTAVTSNVPGPTQAIRVQGKLVREMGFFLPSVGNVGVGISFLSYRGEMVMGVNCDVKTCAEPQALLDAMVEELNVLWELAENRVVFENEAFEALVNATTDAF